MIDFIFVPQGEEYQAVSSGFSPTSPHHPPIIPIPLGSAKLVNFLETWAENQVNLSGKKALLMGLGGSICDELNIGDIALYHSCFYQGETYPCYSELPLLSNHQLVRGMTVDRIITSSQEKQVLGKETQRQVIDMEAGIILKTLPQLALSVIRIISDGLDQDIPNIAKAITPQGTLNRGILFREFIRHPLAAYALIKGSLHALSQLKKVSVILSHS